MVAPAERSSTTFGVSPSDDASNSRMSTGAIPAAAYMLSASTYFSAMHTKLIYSRKELMQTYSGRHTASGHLFASTFTSYIANLIQKHAQVER